MVPAAYTEKAAHVGKKVRNLNVDRSLLQANPLLAFTSRWLAPESLGAFDFKGNNEAVTLPEEVGGYARRFFYALGKESELRFVEFFPRKPASLQVTLTSEGPYLFINIALEGKWPVTFPNKESMELKESEYDLSALPEKSLTLNFHAGEKCEALFIVLSQKYIQEALEGEEIPPPLRHFMDGKADDFAVRCQGTQSLRHLAERIRTHPYKGHAARLHINGCIYRILAEVITDLNERGSVTKRIKPLDLRRAIDARDILMDNLRNPPSLSKLAKTVGISQRKLNCIFCTLFDGSVSDCLKKWRFDLACILLKDHNTTIKEIGHKLGYTHSNNFILAFSRYFGTSPNRWRRKNQDKSCDTHAENA